MLPLTSPWSKGNIWRSAREKGFCSLTKAKIPKGTDLTVREMVIKADLLIVYWVYSSCNAPLRLSAMGDKIRPNIPANYTVITCLPLCVSSGFPEILTCITRAGPLSHGPLSWKAASGSCCCGRHSRPVQTMKQEEREIGFGQAASLVSCKDKRLFH